jgi:hypothetical protein
MIPLILPSGIHIQKINITQSTSQHHIKHSITKKFYPLRCWYDTISYERSYPWYMLLVTLHVKPLAGSVPSLYHLNSCTPINTKPLMFLLQLLSVSLPCRGSFRFKCQTTCPFSFAKFVPKNPSKSEALCNISQRAGCFGEELLAPHRTAQSCVSPLVGCALHWSKVQVWKRLRSSCVSIYSLDRNSIVTYLKLISE